MNLEIPLLALAIPLCISLLLPASNIRRLALVTTILFFTSRYVAWRCTNFPYEQFWSSAAGWWMATVLLVELLAIIEYLQFLITITWLKDRKTQADGAEARLRHRYATMGRTSIPSVDVLIPTYNEGMDVLSKTILAASNIDYPRLQVYVLDDGNRNWLHKYCQEIGVNYITRPNRQGAKAGNINHALSRIHGDLSLILDADFIPFQNCLWRMAGFFDNASIATVQTPQTFYNPDAIQHNLNISSSWGCEQEFFFQIIMPGRDSIGAAFCCGSCCLQRNSALIEIGGFPTSSITEDILLTIKLVEKGWKTLYLREAVTVGLAAEEMESFFIQRKRWGRGNIQVGYQVIQEKGLNTIQKVLFFPFYWMIQPGSRIFFQFIPIVFFLTGTGPLPAAPGQEVIDYQLSFILSVTSSMFILMRPYYMPVFTEAMSLFSAFALLPELLNSLAKPYSKGFGVTPKGKDSANLRKAIFKATFLPSIALLIINIAVLLLVLLDVSNASRSVGWELATYSLFWCGMNTTVLVICILLSLQRPEPRQEHRIEINRPARLITPQGLNSTLPDPAKSIALAGILRDLSMDGGRLQPDEPLTNKQGTANIKADTLLVDKLQLPVERAWINRQGDIVFTFAKLSTEAQRQLVCYAFSGAFRSAEQPRQVRLIDTVKQLARLAMG